MSSKFIKVTTITTSLLLLLIISSPLIFGLVIKQIVSNNMRHDTLLGAYQLTLQNYQLGFRRSHASITLASPTQNISNIMIALTFWHGPLIPALNQPDHWQLGQTRIHFDINSPQYPTIQISGDILVNLFGNVQSNVILPAFDYNAPLLLTLKAATSYFHLYYANHTKQLQLQFTSPQLMVDRPHTHINLQTLDTRGLFTAFSNNTWLTNNFNLRLAHAEITYNTMLYTIRNLRVMLNKTIKHGYLNTVSHVAIDQFHIGTHAFSDMQLTITADHLRTDAAQLELELFGLLQHPTLDTIDIIKIAYPFADGATLHLQACYHNNVNHVMQLQASIKVPATPTQQYLFFSSSLPNLATLQNIEGELTLTMPKEDLQTLEPWLIPWTQALYQHDHSDSFIQWLQTRGYIQTSGFYYTLHAEYQQGKWQVNHHPLTQ